MHVFCFQCDECSFEYYDSIFYTFSHHYNLSTQEIQHWLVGYINEWQNFGVVGEHSKRHYLEQKRTHLAQWCWYIKENGNCTDELVLYLLSRICNKHISIICKDKVYYYHTTPPEHSQPTDCDFMFVYLGKNDIREVKICTLSHSQIVQIKVCKPPSDNDWEPKGNFKATEKSTTLGKTLIHPQQPSEWILLRK